MTGLGLVVVLGASSLAGAQLVALPVLWAWRRLLEARPRSAPTLARWHPAVLLLPVAVGLLLPLGALGALASACHCAVEPGLHLCAWHPELVLPLVPYAAAVCLLLGVGPARKLLALARMAARGRRLRSLLGDGAGPHLVDLGTPDALTLGMLRPVIIADRRWWSTLTEGERAIVVAHEQAHAQRRDLLTHGVMRALAAFLPPRLAEPLIARWLDRAEQCADRHAAAVDGDPLAVAELLIRQRRLGAVERLAPGLHGGSFERRVAALADLRDPTAPLSPDLDGTFAVALVSLPVLALTLGPQLHGLAEATLRFLF